MMGLKFPNTFREAFNCYFLAIEADVLTIDEEASLFKSSHF
jgi:hypothetical protein